MVVTTAGNTLTSGQCFASLFSPAKALLGSTADQSTPWVSTGIKTMAIAGGAQNLPAGDYYVGFWYNGTTGPTFLRTAPVAGASSLNSGLATPNLLWGTADTGLTTTAPNPMGAQTAAGNPWWVALS